MEKLKNICKKIEYGYTASANEMKIGPKFLRITDIQNVFIEWEKVPYCEIDLVNYEKYKLHKNDIVIARTGASTGINTIIDKDVPNSVFASYLIRLIIKEEYNPLFVHFFLQSIYYKNYIDSILGGSAQPNANANELTNVFLPAVERKYQDKICNILSSINNKIKINNRSNVILEKISQLLFKHWFIDFEFPNEQGKPYKSSGGEFIDSELGKIPKGWSVGYFNSFNFEIISGDWGSEEYSDKNNLEIYCIRGTDLAELNINKFINLPIRFIEMPKNKNKLLYQGDLIIEISGGSPTQSTGRSLIVTKEMSNFYNNKLICSNFCKIIRPYNIEESFYLYYLLKLLYNKKILFNFETGTTGIKNLDLKYILTKYRIINPNKETIKKFFNKIYSIILKMHNNAIQNSNLIQIRDLLLPKLITGKIRVNLENTEES